MWDAGAVKRWFLAAALVVIALGAAVALAASGPRAPSKLRAKQVSGGVRLSWRDRSNDETRFEVVYRRAGGRGKVKRLRRNRTSWTQKVTSGTFSYRVRACNAKGCSRTAGPVSLTVGSGGAGGSIGGNAPIVGGCAVFPDDNPWNQDVSSTPVHAKSRTWIDAIGGGDLHPDFGSDPTYGIPFTVAAADQQPVPVTFTQYPDESDPGPYPIPLDAPVEGGANSDGDRHVLALQQGSCKLFELYDAHPRSSRWDASNGAVFDLRSNALRTEGWTSADAAGLPILPGLVRYDEVAAGEIRHAIRFTAPRTQSKHIHPATHDAGSDDPGLPPMGLRVRLAASFDISGFHGAAKVILTAMKRYGMLLADNGSGWFFQGASDPRWDDEDLNQLKRVPGSAFEAVETGPLRG